MISLGNGNLAIGFFFPCCFRRGIISFMRVERSEWWWMLCEIFIIFACRKREYQVFEIVS